VFAQIFLVPASFQARSGSFGATRPSNRRRRGLHL